MAGLYIHIPFCASRCIYCGFYSTTMLAWRSRYVEALCREMDMLAERPLLQTIYLGGGTPSQLSHSDLLHLFTYIYKVFPIAHDVEITMECNPDDVHAGMFQGLPVNRVSMGAQTFDDGRLRMLHRRHTAKEVGHAMDILRSEGINNISIDLMFGFPNETLQEWNKDMDYALQLKPEHLSAYNLMYEEGTPLKRMLDNGTVEEIDEGLAIDMYSSLIDKMKAHHYEHYEISNFARTVPGSFASQANVSPYRSRHNSSYWSDTPYVGIGAAAHSYDGHVRHWAVADIKEYIDSIEQGRLPYEEEAIDAKTHYNDMVTTSLRTREGIDLGKLEPSFRRYLLAAAKEHINHGLLKQKGRHISLTFQGILISNQIMADLMYV